jgi:PAS domain S-box-containing protein
MAIEMLSPPAAISPAAEANLLIDLLPTMAWTTDPDGRVDFVNRQCCAFTGLPRERLVGSGMAECLHPEDQKIRQQFQVQLAELRQFESEYRMRRFDGEYIRCLSRAVPVRDSAGQVVKWVGTTVDIENVRRTTDDLKLQDEHLQLALESADVGIWRLKLPSYELTADERTRRHLDLDRPVIPGYQPQDYIHPQDFERSSSQVPDANGRYVTEHRVRHRNGSYRWQAIHWRLFMEGEGDNATPALITGTSMDITPRKEAEQEREELGQRYRIALAAAELGTWGCDVEEGVMHLDERSRAHFNVGKATLTFEQCLARIHGADRERTIQEVRRQLRESPQKNRANIEFRVRHPDGEVRWLSAQLRLIVSADKGRSARLIGVTRDITENKQAVEKVRQVNAELERRVQQRTTELTAANEELESFAYTVSHDLRAPLRAIGGFCDALIEDFGKTLPQEAHGYLQHVIDGSRHLGDIVDGLLTLSRSTRDTLRRDAVDLSSVAENVLSELARVEPDRRVTWTIEPELRAYGDSRMIDGVMRNLLGNAWKYTANRTDAVIRIYGEQVEGRCVFYVEDNGAGFNMEHAAKLFQPFQRLHRQDEFSGLGIGLATVQRIIHRHGGEVYGEGVPGQGAIFRFSLPLANELVASSTEQERNQ